MTAALVILAAGSGTRYGGDKQLEEPGPAGETIIDYSIHDAIAGGFSRIVLVVRPELRSVFETGIAARWRDRIACDLVVQPPRAVLSAAPGDAPTVKSWGTAHAVLCAASVVRGTFAVINGDDFYGQESIQQAHARCANAGARDAVDGKPEYAVFGFPLASTMSARSSVRRALISQDDKGFLTAIEEAEVHFGSGNVFDVATAMGSRTATGDVLVSMNMWAFTPAVFRQLDDAFAEFSYMSDDDPRAEFMLPGFVGDVVRDDAASIRVIPVKGNPTGLTHRTDLAHMQKFLLELAKSGDYPSPVWR